MRPPSDGSPAPIRHCTSEPVPTLRNVTVAQHYQRLWASYYWYLMSHVTNVWQTCMAKPSLSPPGILSFYHSCSWNTGLPRCLISEQIYPYNQAFRKINFSFKSHRLSIIIIIARLLSSAFTCVDEVLVCHTWVVHVMDSRSKQRR